MEGGLLPPPKATSVLVHVLWVTVKNLRLKFAAPVGFAVELLLPAFLATALVPAWLAAEQATKPERNFTVRPVVDLPAVMDPYKCVSGGTIVSPVTQLPYCQCNTSAVLPCIGTLCLDTTGDALTLYDMGTSYEGPLVPPDLDTVILVQQAGKQGLIGDGSEMSNRDNTASFVVGTRLVLLTEHPEHQHLVDAMAAYFGQHSVLFNEVRMQFETEDQLTDFTYDEGHQQVLAAVVVNGPYDYRLRVNRSATANTRKAQEWGDPSGLSDSYKKYVSGGFISVQQLVNNFWLHHGTGGQYPVAQNDMVVAPFYIPSYVEDEFLVMAGGFLPLVFVIAYVFFVGQYVGAIVKEKEDRIAEGMLVMGLSPAAFEISWHLLGIMEGVVMSFTLALVLKASYFGNSSLMLMFLLTLLFSISIVAAANLVACFFSKAQIAGLVAPFLYLLTVIPRFATSDPSSVSFLKIFSTFTYSGAMSTVAELEKSGRGLGSGTMGDGEEPVSEAIIFLVLDTVLYVVLEWYLKKVLPSEWGTHRHPCFCLPCVKEKPKAFDLKEAPPCMRAEKVTDPDVLKREVVSINKLSKCFSGHDGVFTAVNSLSLKMYEGQALVLLGHNGAGKTTTINMMTGMLPVTAGDAVVFGNSTVGDMARIRKDMGLCPQHNILWPTLTCREHLLFFGRLRGLRGATLHEEVNTMLHDVQLDDRADYQTCGLSGGMKRKLSVAIALVGGPRLVIFDEPTAGMDIQARRAIWDLIQKNKKGRTILLTTHFMDEADLLGDSIAIMSHGRLHSWGSGFYLKNNLGVGYNLRCEVSHKCIPSAIEALMQQEVEQVNTDDEVHSKVDIVSSAGRELVLRLPMHAVSAFPKILRRLETNGEELGVLSFGISVTTLEEVFIKIAQDNVSHATHDPTQEEGSEDEQKHDHKASGEEHSEDTFGVENTEKVTGTALVVQQYKACLMKRFYNGKRDKRTLCFQLFLPVTLIALALGLSLLPLPSMPARNLNPGGLTEVVTNPSTYTSSYVKAGTYVALPSGANESWAYVEDVLSSTYWEHSLGRMCALTADITTPRLPYSYQQPQPCLPQGNVTLQKGERSARLYASKGEMVLQLFVPSANDTGAAFFNGSFLHTLPQAVHVYHTTLLRAASGNHSLTIETVNAPLPNSKTLETKIESFQTIIIGLFVTIPFLIVPSTYVSFLVKEKQCKAKHIQLASGVNLGAFWMASMTWDLCSYFVTAGAAFSMFGAFTRDEYVGSSESAAATFLLFFFYGLSSIGCSYLASFYFETYTQAQSTVSGCSLFAGFILVLTTNILESISSTNGVSKVLRHMFRVMPSFCIGDGIIALATIPIMESFGRGTFSPLDMDVVGWDVVWMAVEAPIFFCATALHDYPELLFVLGLKRPPPAQPSGTSDVVLHNEDADVATERHTVEAVDPVEQKEEFIISVNKLTKEYASLGTSGKTRAVKGVSFNVLKDEVFCLLGTNGAGKTTIISVVSGEIPPTTGTVHVKGYDVTKETSNARSELGYCPQFDALLDLLTPQEHLEFYCDLRGVPPRAKHAMCDAIIYTMGLAEYRHKQCKQLSGGNKRKVSIAISLTGSPAALLLDEPTAGMDPVARRSLWTALKAVGRGRSVILTTHHLEEVDALAHRLAIMVSGRLQCIGTLNHLKQKFGDGYELEVKMSDKTARPGVEQFVEGTFEGSSLVEQTGDRLTYHLNKQGVALSDVFSELEAHSKELRITDYSVSQTSLEQVFMSICKRYDEQHAVENPLSLSIRSTL